MHIPLSEVDKEILLCFFEARGHKLSRLEKPFEIIVRFDREIAEAHLNFPPQSTGNE